MLWNLLHSNDVHEVRLNSRDDRVLELVLSSLPQDSLVLTIHHGEGFNDVWTRLDTTELRAFHLPPRPHDFT
jgi:hypothetical protein